MSKISLFGHSFLNNFFLQINVFLYADNGGEIKILWKLKDLML